MAVKQKILVLNATGKAGSNVCRALKEASFDVYGTTRSQNKNHDRLGIKSVICNYTVKSELEKSFKDTGAKRVFVITDYFGAANSNMDLEIEQGKNAIDAAKAAGVKHLIFMSVADAECFNDHVRHIRSKLALETYLKASGVPYSIVRPCAFFENLDDAKNWNPLKKGKIKFMTEKECKYCATYDIGRAAALMFKNPKEWLEKTLDVIGWKGDLSQIAQALEKVSGTPVKASLAMPIFFRKFFFKDLHHMFIYFENGGPKGEPDEFKKVIPDALSAEEWFKFHGHYANGRKITPE